MQLTSRNELNMSDKFELGDTAREDLPVVKAVDDVDSCFNEFQ